MTSTVETAVSLPQQRPDLSALRGRLAGTLLEPHDEAFAAHSTPWNVSVPMTPTAVVAATTAQDVVEAVRFALAHRLSVGVQATGHGAVSALAGSLLVSTRGLDELTVHPEQRWARVGAGVKWGRVTEALAPYGLAGLCGSTGDVSVVGYLTGGGIGPMARTYGLAADTVRAFEVVTGDGVLRRATPTEHADLFFALRGGKGATGIVTAVEIDLVELPTFYGGALYFDGADAAAVIDRWRSWSAALPEAGTTSFVLLQLPEMPMVPPQLANRLSIGVRFLWTGEAAEGERLLDEMRAVAQVLVDDASVRPFAAIDSVHADPVDPMPVVESAMLLRSFTAEAAAALLATAGTGSGSPQIAVEVRQLGGAISRPGEHPSAFDQRDAGFSVLTVGIAFDPSVAPHGSSVLAALAPWDTGGAWPNFAPPHDAATARRAYDPATLARLAAIARAYDPAGVLAAGAYTRTI